RHLDECARCAKRMRQGLDYLKQDAKALQAFQLANYAILLQQIRSRREPRKAEFDSKTKRISFSEGYTDPDPLNPPEGRGTWRPFQIAFLLMTVRSAVDEHAPDRRTVELIWFPTGGGKTEAYLGLAAYATFMRRIKDPSDVGVHVLMRYTLRLLTAQQFQRASSLLCAMEHLRRKNTNELGKAEFSIGIWLGGATTPNTRQQALSDLRKLQKGHKFAENSFILSRCPWCRAEMGPVTYGKKKLSKSVPRVLGYERRGNTVIFRCPDHECEFSGEHLPIYVIDEDIYERCPSLVVGTVDKFAMLAWKPEARALFGIQPDGARHCSPPGLIIQDELHLISGPLGSMVGLYESVVEELCTDRRRSESVLPKIVSSTATIRRYADQIKCLYARDDVALFPPPGLEAGDSFFARYARYPDGTLMPGRIYAGVHASGLGSMQTAQVRTFTSLLQASFPLSKDERDPWWTLMLFFNSLRELGTTLSLLQSDIPDYFWVLKNRTGVEFSDLRSIWNILELTGRLSSEKVPQAISALEISCTSADHPVDVCLASNIIEVGIDIDRLSLRGVVVQPKTTSPYIHVTGGLGRRWWERPGLVVTIYTPYKPRDRSHFEKFRSYHERLYAQVEPTSVTPFSPPALDRALHAVMVGYARQAGDESVAGSPYPYPAHLVEELQKILLPRVEVVDLEERENFNRVFQERADEWRRWERTLWSGVPQDGDLPLLREAGKYASHAWSAISWATPLSMRNVDAECQAEITQLYLDDTDEN
ncbi:MAG: helicase, partial [Candidatus Poribacteria bacterium]|nr:helicase [Candidatus Poribacteria bacterium]